VTYKPETQKPETYNPETYKPEPIREESAQPRPNNYRPSPPWATTTYNYKTTSSDYGSYLQRGY